MRIPAVPLVFGLTVAAMSGPALASSADAWAEFDARVTKACLAASGIRNARPSTVVGFDDRMGMVAMLASDRTRGSSRSKLCLYDKKAGKAYVDDAETSSAVRRRAAHRRGRPGRTRLPVAG